MTLGNMRVRSPCCWLCHHRTIFSADPWPDQVPVPEAIMLAHGFTTGMLDALVRDALATAQRRAMRALALLREGGERPRRRATNPRNELPSSHRSSLRPLHRKPIPAEDALERASRASHPN
jgi:hypothetical protein